MYAGRVQEFIVAIQRIFDKTASINVLDLGGGSGVLAIELAKCFPHASAVVFDQPSVIPVADEGIKENGLASRLNTRTGNFIEDDFGSDYNLIIASGILDFCGDLDDMAARIYCAIKAGGYLYVDTHQVNDSYTEPSQCIIGWLASHMDGLDILKTDRQITAAIEKAGFIRYPDNRDDIPYYIFKKE